MDQGGLFTIAIYFGVFILIFWLFIVAPRRKQEKKHAELISSLKKGEKVVTIGGIKGEIAKVKEDFVVLRVADNIEIEILPKAVAYKVDQD